MLVHPRVFSHALATNGAEGLANSTHGDGEKNRLMLPGLNQVDNIFPSLHLYFQQKLFHDSSYKYDK